MLYLSLNPGLLTFISSSEKDGTSIVEDTGKIPVPFTVNRTFFYKKDALSQVTSLFKSLKENQGYHQTEIALSLPPNLLTYSLNDEPVPAWMDKLRFGKVYSDDLSRKSYTLEKGHLTVWYDPRIMDLLMKAAQFAGYSITRMTPGIVNAINSVHMIYSTEDYEKYAILKWDSGYPEIVVFKEDILCGYMCFKPQNPSLILNVSGDVHSELPENLKADLFSEHLFDITGPLFLYSVHEPETDPLQPFKRFGFCEIINPWTGLEVANTENDELSGHSDTELSLWTESAGFINRE